MRQSLNVLPVRHEYAPGAEPSLWDLAVAFFSSERRAEQYLVVVGLAVFAGLAVMYLWTSSKARRLESAVPMADRGGVFGASMRSLRQGRMPGGAKRGGSGWEPPAKAGGRLGTRAPSSGDHWAARRKRKVNPLDDTYLAEP